MALVGTTLSSAVAVGDKSIVVASATSVAAGRLVRVDGELMQVTKDYSSGTTVPVLRAINGTAQVAHVSGASVVHGLASDFDDAGPGVSTMLPSQRPVVISSISATSTLTLAPAGCDQRVILNGTSVITLTIPAPSLDQDGMELVIISNGAAAHVPTFTSGLGGAGSGYDAITNNATGRMCLVVYAANQTWQIPQAPALTGTVTNITGGVA